MMNKKKLLTAAVTMSLVMGVYGVAGAADPATSPSVYGSTDTTKTVEGVTKNSSTTGVNKTEDMSSLPSATPTDVDYTVTGGTWKYAYGGAVNSGNDTKNNKVTISSGTVIGGAGKIFDNTVNASAVVGGFTYQGNAIYNEVNISGGTIGNNVYGGYVSAGTKNAENNTVKISSGSVSGSVYGGYARNGKASGNTVTVSGTASITGDVNGGYSKGSGTVSNNTVDISGGTVNKFVIGGNSTSGTVSNNTVNISGTADVSNASLYGYIGTSGGGNTLNIGAGWSGSIKSVQNFDVVNINAKDTDLTNSPTGFPTAYAQTDVIFDSALTNIGTLNVKDAQTSLTFKAAGNSVTTANLKGTVNFCIPSGTTSGTMLTVAGTADLSGATINTDTTNFNGDTITLISAGTLTTTDATTYQIDGTTGKTKDVDANITGMTSVAMSVGYDTSVANKLSFGALNYKLTGDSDITGSATLSKDFNANGKAMNFYIPATAESKTTMLTLNNSSSMDLTNVTINAGVAKDTKLTVGDYVYLIKNNGTGQITNLKQNTNDVKALKANDYQSYDLSFYLANADNTSVVKAESGNALVAEIKGKHNDIESKSPVETQAAGLSMLTSGGDMMIGAGMDSATAVAKAEAAAASTAMAPFAAVGGGSNRLNSGSHVDVKSYNINVGFAKEVKNSAGKLLFGPLVEYGKGTYNSYLDSGYHADGKSKFAGVGFIAKQTNKNNFYYEGSARVGRLQNEYNSAGGSYDEGTTYYALHAGLGKVYPLNANSNIDCYLKFFWTHQNGINTMLASNVLDMDAVNSFRSKLGFRYNYSFSKKNAMYAGLAWQDEFSGTANATFDGMATASPSIKGHTGYLELGWKNYAGKNMDFDLGVTGSAGKTRGIGASAKLNWKF